MKRILMVTLSMSMAIAAFAQRGSGQRGFGGAPPAGTFERGQRGDPSTALKNALNLTDAQVASVQSLMQTRQERAKAIFDEMQTKQQAVDTALNATSPDPSTVGNAMIALQATRKKLDAERDWFLGELKKLLTADQQATLDKLIADGKPIPGLMGPGFGGPRGGRGPRPGGL